MKTPRFVSWLSLAALLVFNTGAAEPAPKAAAPADPEVKANFDKINLKMREGKRTPEALAEEVKTFDNLIAARRKTAPEGAAYAAYLKAALYLQVFQDAESGNAMLKAIPVDFPATYYAVRAQAMLDSLERRAQAEANFAVGKKFPEFAEKDLAGQPLSLAGLKGKVVLVDFWATWCGPCIGELPHVKAAYEKHNARGFEIVGISLDDDQKRLTDFLAKNQMTWPQFFDGLGWKNKLAQHYGIQSIPATFLLDREGKIIARDLRGPALEAAVARALNP